MDIHNKDSLNDDLHNNDSLIVDLHNKDFLIDGLIKIITVEITIKRILIVEEKPYCGDPQ